MVHLNLCEGGRSHVKKKSKVIGTKENLFLVLLFVFWFLNSVGLFLMLDSKY